MRCSILLAAVCFAISAWGQTQPASQEEINRALDVLRKTPAVAPPQTAKPGVPIKVTTTTNFAPSLAPGKPLVLPPPATSALTSDMERRAREVLEGTKVEPRAQATTPAKEVLDRANAREELRKQAVEETRRGLPRTATAQPGTLAEEQQRKAQEEIDRQKNLERIEMEVQRAKLARQQKAASQAEAAKTNAPAPATAATPTNAPAIAATPTNAPVVATKAPVATPKPEVAAPITSDQEAKARALLNELLAQPAPKPAPAPAPPAVAQPTPPPAPAPAPVAPPVQASTPVPAKPAPVAPAQPVAPPPEPKPVVVQQTPPPVVTPAPAPAAVPIAAQQPPPQSAPAFKGLAPDMEQRARSILDQVMLNTKGASLPVLATPPPKPAPVIPSQPQPEPQPTVPAAAAPVAVTTTPAVPAPVITKAPTPTPQTEALTPMATDQEAKARALLNQTLATLPTPTTPAPNTTVETKIAPEGRRAQEDARRQAKLKAEIEDQTRREIARMEEESQARAREMAKRRLEEEKRGQRKPQTAEVAAAPAVKPATATVRSTPAPSEPKPAAAKPAEKPRHSKNDATSKAPAPVEETWKDTNKSREQRLTELLEAYRKDQISAQQYHSERAKILGSPQ